MVSEFVEPFDITNIVTEYNALIDEIGFDARITVGLNLDAEPEPGEYVVAALWPKGTTETRIPAVRATGKDFAECLRCLRDGWEEGKRGYREQRVRTMAMLIINMTATNGSCTREDLTKIGQFSEQEVTAYGDEAVTDANSLTEKGPFKLNN